MVKADSVADRFSSWLHQIRKERKLCSSILLFLNKKLSIGLSFSISSGGLLVANSKHICIYACKCVKKVAHLPLIYLTPTVDLVDSLLAV